MTYPTHIITEKHKQSEDHDAEYMNMIKTMLQHCIIKFWGL